MSEKSPTKKSTVDHAKELNPKTTHYEFLGPLGALAMTSFLPLLLIFFASCCDASGYPSQLLLDDWRTYFDRKLSPGYFRSLYDPAAMAVYLGFVLLQVFLHITLPGDRVPGSTLRDGTKLKYRMNGLLAFFSTICGVAYGINKWGVEHLLFVYDHWVGLTVASIAFSYAVSLFVYCHSFLPGALLALGGNTGNPIYDFMIGRELNPRIGDFDIKFFTELRPGMLGWMVINICFAAKQFEELGYVTNAMVLVIIVQTVYIFDSLYNEEAVLTTMDITTDGFGFMLAFGLYSWVPMTYTLQARYLVDFARDMSWLEFGLILSLNFLGYYIFRSTNSQKNMFRTSPNDPKVKDLKYITTKTGSKLLISGWWGISRHINYLGDWLMALSWCLTCGFGSFVPYFYAIYFGILLLHRERRDDHKCRTKYGEDWEKYCGIVKYRIIPGIY